MKQDNASGLPSPDARIKVGALIDEWLEFAESGLRESTFERYTSLLNMHLRPALGNIAVIQLQSKQLTALYRERHESGLSPRTCEFLHRVIFRMLKQAMLWNYVVRNVAATELVSLPRKQRSEIVPLTGDETRRFLESATSDRLSALHVLLCHTGLRLGEALALRWDDIAIDDDKSPSRVTVVNTLRHIKGMPRLLEPKTSASTRQVPLNADVVVALRHHRAVQAKDRLRLGDAWANGESQWTELVFTSEVGSPIRHENFLRRSFRPNAKAAGLSDSVTPHTLRHTFASLALSAGVPITTVSVTLGHASITTTMHSYAHLVPGTESGATDALAAALSTSG